MKLKNELQFKKAIDSKKRHVFLSFSLSLFLSLSLSFSLLFKNNPRFCLQAVKSDLARNKNEY
jgi:hypothetical protein